MIFVAVHAYGFVFQACVGWSKSPIPHFSQTDLSGTGQLFSCCPNLWQLIHRRGFGMLTLTGIIR